MTRFAGSFGVAAAALPMIDSVTQRFAGAQHVEIAPARTRRLVRAFIELPYAMYAHDAHWVPPLRRDEHRRFSPRHNPFLAHASVDLWLALERGRPVGRIAAIHDRLSDEFHAERVTWFGFFEARDAAVAASLLGAVEEAAAARGSLLVRGPANPSLNESAGLLVDAFDEDPYLLMPYNPPSYRGFIEAAGYSKAMDLLAWTIGVTAPPARIARVAERAARRHGVTVRPANLRAFDRELATLQEVYSRAWERNWGFVPPTAAEIRQLAVDLRPIVDPQLALFAEIAGTPVGLAIAVPDLNQVLKRMRGRLFPFGFVHFLRRRSIVTQTRVLLLGVLPEYRRIGLYPLLIAELQRRALAGGYRRAELSWTLEDNGAVNAGIEAAGGRRYKTYRVYEKKLGIFLKPPLR